MSIAVVTGPEDVKKKFVELLDSFPYDLSKYRGDGKYFIIDDHIELANYLVDNGATIRTECYRCAESANKVITELQEKIAELRKEREWIKITDRLPTENDAGLDQSVYAYTKTKKLLVLYWQDVVNLGSHISHWMPLHKVLAPEEE